MPVRKLIVPKDGKKPRIEAFLAAAVPGVSVDRARRLLAEGRVKIRGKTVKAQRALWGGEEVEITFADPLPVPREDGPKIDVLHEDADLIVINKPPGLVVEPNDGSPSLVLLLATQKSGWNVEGHAAPGVVHRLDRETSGCLILARTDDAVAMLQQAFEEKRIAKRYLALVLGAPPEEGRLDTPYGKNPDNARLYSSRVSSPRRAVLAYRVRERLPDTALVDVDLETGRTHQIRVQLSDVGHGVIGDPLYGPAEARSHRAAKAIGRLALHAASLHLTLPTREIHVEAPLPSDFQAAIDAARS